jgi:hypothetical protein
VKHPMTHRPPVVVLPAMLVSVWPVAVPPLPSVACACGVRYPVAVDACPVCRRSNDEF